MRNRAWLAACVAALIACTPGLALAESSSPSDAYDKLSVPTVDKDVSLDGKKWVDEVDSESFDHLYYRVTGTLPEYVEPYDKYPYAFVDRRDASITIDADTVKVSLVHGSVTKDVTGSFSVAFSDDGVMTVSCKDLRTSFPGLDREDKFVLSYEADLGRDPDTGLADPNENGCKVTYMAERAPVASAIVGGYGLGEPQETVESLTYAYTYSVEVSKVADGEKTPLSGAGFAIRDDDGRWLCRDGWSEDESARVVGRTDADGILKLGNMGTGTFTLVEVEAPEGYAKCADVRLSIERGRGDNGRPYLGAEASGAEVTSVDAASGKVRVLVSDPREGAGTDEADKSAAANGGNGTSLGGSSYGVGSGGGGSAVSGSRESLSKTGDESVASSVLAALAAFGAVSALAGGIRRVRG